MVDDMTISTSFFVFFFVLNNAFKDFALSGRFLEASIKLVLTEIRLNRLVSSVFFYVEVESLPFEIKQRGEEEVKSGWWKVIKPASVAWPAKENDDGDKDNNSDKWRLLRTQLMENYSPLLEYGFVEHIYFTAGYLPQPHGSLDSLGRYLSKPF